MVFLQKYSNEHFEISSVPFFFFNFLYFPLNDKAK